MFLSSIKCKLWGSSVMEGLLQGCSSDCSHEVVLQMPLPGRSSFPGKTASQQLPPGRSAIRPQEDSVGMTRITVSPAQSQKTCFCCHCLQWRQVLGLLGEADQSLSYPRKLSTRHLAWKQLEQSATFKDAASAFHPNNHDRYQETNRERAGWILYPCQQFLPLFFGAGLSRSSWWTAQKR